MASVNFFTAEAGVSHLSGSGLGFYGVNFGTSVEVGEYQDSTYITDSTGQNQGPLGNNTKWTHPGSGLLNGADELDLNKIPNKWATLQIRFSHSTAVKTQNAELRIYDRSDKNNPASGVTTKVAELIHPDISQVTTGSGDTTWNTPTGSSVVMDSLHASPGVSGMSPNGPSTTDNTHDWYFVVTASPDSIGSKTLYGLYFEVEYL